MLPGYKEVRPLVFCGLYPLDSADYEKLKAAHHGRLPSQPLLVPATFAAEPVEIAAADDHADELDRLGFATEFASMACELLSNSYMNGETIRVDGGIRMPPKS